MGDKTRRKARAGYARRSGGKFSAKDGRGRKRKATSTSSDISGVESRGVDEEVWCESAYDNMDVCHVCEAAGDEIADDMDALEVCEDIDIMEGVNGERLDKFVKNFDKPFRPKDCNQSLYGIKKGCGNSKTQWYSHKKDRELREQSHRGPGIEGYLKKEDMNESESLLASLEDEAYEKGSVRLTDETLDEYIKELQEEGATTSRSQKVEGEYLGWQRIVSKAILGYFRAIREPNEEGNRLGLVEASIQVTFYMYDGSLGVDSYRSRKVREWGRHYATYRRLPMFKQGEHSKRLSPIADEFSREKMREYLRGVKDLERTPHLFAKAYNEDEGGLRSSLVDAAPMISVDTARRWMIIVGFTCRAIGNRPRSAGFAISARNLLCISLGFRTADLGICVLKLGLPIKKIYV